MRRRSCSIPASGSSGWRRPASRSPSSSTSTQPCGRRRTTRSSSASGTGVELSGFLMTPDAAFGFERRGTPDALAELGRARRLRRRGRPAVHARRTPGPQLRDPRGDRGRRPGRGGGHSWAGRSRSPAPLRTGAATGSRLDFELPLALPPDGRVPVPGRRPAGHACGSTGGVAYLRADVARRRSR